MAAKKKSTTERIYLDRKSPDFKEKLKETIGVELTAEDLCCDEKHIHEEILRQLDVELPDEGELCELAELFKVFGDSTRIKILYALHEEEVCVCDLAEALNMTQSAISHQLKILKQSKLVKSRRDGKQIFYSLADEHVHTIIAQGREHIEEP